MLKPTIDSRISVCKECSLYKNCSLFPIGQFGAFEKTPLLIISQKPTKEEFSTNLPWYDLQHKKIIELVKSHIKFPVKYSYAIKCPNSDKPKDIKFCLDTWLNNEIKDCQAKCVMFLGRELWKNYGAKKCNYNPKSNPKTYLNKIFVDTLDKSTITFAFAESPNKIYITGDKKLEDFVKLLKIVNTTLGVV